jgi:hypothetical protein
LHIPAKNEGDSARLAPFLGGKYYRSDQANYRGSMKFYFFPLFIRQHDPPDRCHFRQGLREKPCRVRRGGLSRFMIAVILFAIFLPVISLAQPSQKDAPKSRWSGRVEQGFMGVATTSKVAALTPDDCPGLSNSYAKIDSLDKNLDFENYVEPFLLFNVNYQMTDTSSLYLGTPFFGDDRQGLTTGFQKLFPNDNLLDLSLFVGEDYVWEDPYLTGVKRELTDETSYGLVMDSDGLFGTSIHLNYMLKQTWVIDDVSGDNDSKLRRDGRTDRVKIGYNFYIDENFESLITPSFIYIRDDRKGGANAFNGYGLEINSSIEGDRNAFMVAGSMGTDHYDEIHPVFSKHRNDMGFSFECFYTRKHLWVKNLYLRLGYGFSHIDSSIGFFSETNIQYGFSIGYSFGQ